MWIGAINAQENRVDASQSHEEPLLAAEPSATEDDAIKPYVPSTRDLHHHHLLVGYYEQWAVFGPNIHIDDLALERMTHLVYESAELTPDGKVALGQPVADIYFQSPQDNMSSQNFAGNFQALVRAKQRYPHLKTLLAIGDWDRSTYFSRVANDESLRAAAVASIQDTMQRYQFNGIDIYWLFPVEDDAVEDSARPEDPQNFLLLIQALRYAFDQLEVETGQHYLLTASVDYVTDAHYEAYAAAVDYLDFIHVDSSQFNGRWSDVTDHISPLYLNAESPNPGSVAGLVQALMEHAKVPASKLVINVAPYAQGWQDLQTFGMRGLHSKADAVSWGSWETDENQIQGIYNRDHLQQFREMPGYGEFWDEEAKASYLFSSDRFNGHFLSFESERALAEKMGYIEQVGLAGIGLRSLHNDSFHGNSFLARIYRHYYPLDALWLDTSDAIQRHQKVIVISASIVVFIALLLGTLTYRQHRQTRNELRESQRFEHMTYNLQQMEWSLIQLRQLWTVHQQQADKLNMEALPQINAQVASLLKPVSFLLHETKLGVTPRHSEMRNVHVTEISHHLQTLLNAHPSVSDKNFKLDIQSQATLFVDDSYLIQMLLAIVYLILENTGDEDCIHIQMVDKQATCVGFLIQNQQQNISSFRQQDFLRLKDIYRMAHQLGVDLQHSISGQVCFSFHITRVQNAGSTTLGHQLASLAPATAPEKTISAFTGRTIPQVPAAKTTESPQPLDREREEHTAVEHTAAVIDETAYLDFLQKFNAEEGTADMSKLLERACRYFAVSIGKPLKFSIFQGEQLVVMVDASDGHSERSKEQSNAPHQTDYAAGELHFEIQSDEALSKTDVRYFSVLVNQIQLVRQTLKEMVKEPVLLSELYEVAKNRDRINYVQADQGYTTVYFMGRKNNQVLSSRLRTIKQYFDDDALLQIHRSYLVNPKRVAKVLKKTKYKYELEVADTTLPISRTYLPILKEQYPHWFASL
ncbi:Chitinase A1 [Thalassocella blandensis]|nr:Chitinase A1 [Thalassocella blandensis]